MDYSELFVGGLILATVFVSEALKRFIPDPPKETQKVGFLREVVHKTEIIREPMTSSRGKTVMCPYCNKIIQ